MPSPTPFRIIPCAEWKAKPARRPIEKAGRPSRIIFHHTAGHHPNLDANSGESYAEALAYARAIQAEHMSRKPVPFNDSGHNFLVTRNGYIFEGRHGSVFAIQKGLMVVSAHCPGQNDQPGIEHEQLDPEGLTPIQHQASVWLHAWICKHTGIHPKEIHGHREFFATACPGSLYGGLPQFRKDVAKELTGKKPKVVPTLVKLRGKTFKFWNPFRAH